MIIHTFIHPDVAVHAFFIRKLGFHLHNFFVRIYSIRISRLRFLGMRLAVLNESLHHRMQFKAISGGGEGGEFEKVKLEVKNIRAWEKNSPFL